MRQLAERVAERDGPHDRQRGDLLVGRRARARTPHPSGRGPGRCHRDHRAPGPAPRHVRTRRVRGVPRPEPGISRRRIHRPEEEHVRPVAHLAEGGRGTAHAAAPTRGPAAAGSEVAVSTRADEDRREGHVHHRAVEIERIAERQDEACDPRRHAETVERLERARVGGLAEAVEKASTTGSRM